MTDKITKQKYLEIARIYLASYFNIKEEELTINFSDRIIYKQESYLIKVSSAVITDPTKKIPSWDFDVREYRDGDYLLLIGMKDDLPLRAFLIPIIKVPKAHIRISIEGQSKYHEYEI